ncbi:MAG TPA: M28 family peptidase [Candidatus Kapabacteria bacterium]|nr:M28 family peptidase [Candidatus Kapabacteria bacterium]
MTYSFRRLSPILVVLAIAIIGWYVGCNREKPETAAPEKPAASTQPAIPPAPVPGFDANRAFADIVKQVDMGPRVPNSSAHAKALKWMDSILTGYTPNVELQHFTDLGYSPGETLNLTNVIASFNPSATWRILILTHYDSRPWADEDPNPKNQNTPIPAANDGGSGTAVMLELARQFKDHPPPIGVDLFFDDGEDYGKYKVDNLDRYFLGVKYFVANKPANYNPQVAILLDMVGDTNADFEPETNSVQSAPQWVNEIWNTAKEMGLSHFRTGNGADIEDDHLPLIQAGIPSVDIIDGDLVGHVSPDPNRKYWHTLDDLPKHLAPSTLDEVGRLLLQLIYQRFPRDSQIL